MTGLSELEEEEAVAPPAEDEEEAEWAGSLFPICVGATTIRGEGGIEGGREGGKSSELASIEEEESEEVEIVSRRLLMVYGGETAADDLLFPACVFF